MVVSPHSVHTSTCDTYRLTFTLSSLLVLHKIPMKVGDDSVGVENALLQTFNVRSDDGVSIDKIVVNGGYNGVCLSHRGERRKQLCACL